MSFKDVLGHDKAIEQLTRAIVADRIAHSFLFVGQEGIGKKLVAIQFAKALNCHERGDGDSDSCDRCLSCRKIEGRTHPDVLLLEPDSQTLRVEQVRSMLSELAYRPYEGRRRVCIVVSADRMAPQMSNTLLKTLEEPPLHTVIILLSSQPRLILPTILSRCRVIRFGPLSMEVVTEWLEKKKGLSREQANIVSSLSEGSIGRAVELIEEIEQIPRARLLTEWVGARRLSYEAIERWAEWLPAERERLVSILEVGKTLLRDLATVKLTNNRSKLIHSDLVEQMIAISSDWSLKGLLDRITAIHRTINAVSPFGGSANTRLAVEAMMLSWAEG